MPTTKRKKRKKDSLELTPLAQVFIFWAKERQRERIGHRRRQVRTERVVAFTTPEAIRWITEQEPDAWHVGTWDLLVEELGFEKGGKQLIHEDAPGEWSLTALADFVTGRYSR